MYDSEARNLIYMDPIYTDLDLWCLLVLTNCLPLPIPATCGDNAI